MKKFLLSLSTLAILSSAAINCFASPREEESKDYVSTSSPRNTNTEKKIETPFLFRINGKDLLLGTHHILPIGILPIEARTVMSQCHTLVSEVDMRSENDYKLSDFFSVHLFEILDDLSQAMPNEDGPWAQDINLKELGMDYLEDLLRKNNRTLNDYNPRIFFAFLNMAQQANLEASEDNEAQKVQHREEATGLDTVIYDYFSTKPNIELHAFETQLDRNFAKLLTPGTIEEAKKQILSTSTLPFNVIQHLISEKAEEVKASNPRAANQEQSSEDANDSGRAAIKEQNVRNMLDEKASGILPAYVDTTSVETTSYLAGDFKQLETYLEDLYASLSPDIVETQKLRNKNFYPRMKSIMTTHDEKPTLFIAGVAHLCGETGLLQALTNDSISLEQYNLAEGGFTPFKH